MIKIMLSLLMVITAITISSFAFVANYASGPSKITKQTIIVSQNEPALAPLTYPAPAHTPASEPESK